MGLQRNKEISGEGIVSVLWEQGKGNEGGNEMKEKMFVVVITGGSAIALFATSVYTHNIYLNVTGWFFVALEWYVATRKTQKETTS